jgi:transposase, IS6 family
MLLVFRYALHLSSFSPISFMLSSKRNRKTAKRFFQKALGSKHNQIPRAITVDKNPAYLIAINELKMIKDYLKTLIFDKSSI